MTPAPYTPETVHRIKDLAREKPVDAIAQALGWDAARLIRVAARHTIPVFGTDDIAPPAAALAPPRFLADRVRTISAGRTPRSQYITLSLTRKANEALRAAALRHDINPRWRSVITAEVVRALLADPVLVAKVPMECSESRYDSASLRLTDSERGQLDRVAADRGISAATFAALALDHVARIGVIEKLIGERQCAS